MAGKVYHVSKRASDGKWQVFIKGSDKVIKLFSTKVEAEEYCEKMAKNQGATLLVHKSKGQRCVPGRYARPAECLRPHAPPCGEPRGTYARLFIREEWEICPSLLSNALLQCE